MILLWGLAWQSQISSIPHPHASRQWSTHPWALCQRPRNRHPLLLPAAEAGGGSLRKLTQPNLLQRVLHRCMHCRRRQAVPAAHWPRTPKTELVWRLLRPPALLLHGWQACLPACGAPGQSIHSHSAIRQAGKQAHLPVVVPTFPGQMPRQLPPLASPPDGLGFGKQSRRGRPLQGGRRADAARRQREEDTW